MIHKLPQSDKQGKKRGKGTKKRKLYEGTNEGRIEKKGKLINEEEKRK